MDLALLAVAVVAAGQGREAVTPARVVGVAVVVDLSEAAVAARTVPISHRDGRLMFDRDVVRAECRHLRSSSVWCCCAGPAPAPRSATTMPVGRSVRAGAE